MEITTAAAVTATSTAPIRALEADAETPPRIQPLSYTNGVLKRHQHHHVNNHIPVVVTYKECLKNHAVNLGGHAVDGCGEFMPSPDANPTDPTSLKCAACGCHRNFHRRDPDELFLPPNTITAIEYQPHHRHHPPPPPARGGGGQSSSPNSPSPPPISSSYYPSAPHMLLALSAGVEGRTLENAIAHTNSNGRKRFRTKFTQNQKEKMHEFSERVGWKIQKRDEDLISEFCSEIGVDRSVLKVWMHNNKNTFGKKDQSTCATTNNSNGFGLGLGTDFDIATAAEAATTTTIHYRNNENSPDNCTPITDDFRLHHIHSHDSVSGHHDHAVVAINGSSSSS